MEALPMWTLDNPGGLTQDQLDLINEVLDELVSTGMDESNANDLINNAWLDSITSANELRKACGL